MSGFFPCGVVTLTTDFGHKGPFTATMKGVLLSRFPEVRIVDLTHEIVVHYPAEAGFWLERSYQYFPKGSVHLAVVDPGVGTERDILGVEHDGHAFIAPDNGLLTPLVENSESRTVHRLASATLAALGIRQVSATFHGRDIFAPIAAELAAGRLAVGGMGPPARELIPSWVEAPQAGRGHVDGVVITIDNFGNLITNIDAALLGPFSQPHVTVGGRAVPFRRTYGDMAPGDYLALINSFDVLEIARAEQSATQGLGVERGAPVRVAEAS